MSPRPDSPALLTPAQIASLTAGELGRAVPHPRYPGLYHIPGRPYTPQLHSSASQIAKALQCPRAWAWRYVWGWRPAPGLGSLVGKAGHAVAQKYFDTGEFAAGTPLAARIVPGVQYWPPPSDRRRAEVPIQIDASRVLGCEGLSVQLRGSIDILAPAHPDQPDVCVYDHKFLISWNYQKTEAEAQNDPQTVIYGLHVVQNFGQAYVPVRYITYLTDTGQPPEARTTDVTLSAREILGRAAPLIRVAEWQRQIKSHFASMPPDNVAAFSPPPEGIETCRSAFGGCPYWINYARRKNGVRVRIPGPCPGCEENQRSYSKMNVVQKPLDSIQAGIDAMLAGLPQAVAAPVAAPAPTPVQSPDGTWWIQDPTQPNGWRQVVAPVAAPAVPPIAAPVQLPLPVVAPPEAAAVLSAPATSPAPAPASVPMHPDGTPKVKRHRRTKAEMAAARAAAEGSGATPPNGAYTPEMTEAFSTAQQQQQPEDGDSFMALWAAAKAFEAATGLVVDVKIGGW